MPTPNERRPVPESVEIPELPTGMQSWADFVTKLDPTHTVRYGRRELIIEPVTDGHSAARSLKGYRYSAKGSEWIDEAHGRPGDWRREWIVIAVSELDPFFVDTSKPDLPMYTAHADASSWKPRKAKTSLAAFIAALKVKAPVVYAPYVPPEPLPRNTSVTVLDWGTRRDELQSVLIRAWPNFFQPHILARREQTPAVIMRATYRDLAENMLDCLTHFGARGELGPAIPRPARPAPGTVTSQPSTAGPDSR